MLSAIRFLPFGALPGENQKFVYSKRPGINLCLSAQSRVAIPVTASCPMRPTCKERPMSDTLGSLASVALVLALAPSICLACDDLCTRKTAKTINRSTVPVSLTQVYSMIDLNPWALQPPACQPPSAAEASLPDQAAPESSGHHSEFASLASYVSIPRPIVRKRMSQVCPCQKTMSALGFRTIVK